MDLNDVQFTGYEYTLYCTVCYKNHWQWSEWPKPGDLAPQYQWTFANLRSVVATHLRSHDDVVAQD